MAPIQQMSAVKQAAMFTAANVHAKKDRRILLRHLRHHFGKQSFEAGYKVDMLCEGHADIKEKSIGEEPTKPGV